MSDSYLGRDLSSMVGLSRIWLSLGLVVALTSALLMGLASPAGAVAGYGDVGEGTWYTDAVQWSTDNGIANIAGPCFGPDTPVSRGETAVWIYNMENQPDAGDRHSFTDVTNGYQNDAISWMANTGITTGTSPTTFAPDETLKRAQVATFLHRLKGEPSAPSHNFSDVVAGWQQDSVSWMANTGITTGTSPTTFAPEDALTRAQLITFLYRYKEKPEVTLNTSTPHCDPPPTSESTAELEEEMSLPGEGITVRMARGNWAETNFQNTVLQKLLSELGYDVPIPEEIAPATFFPALALGDFDLWASTWPLFHDPLTAGELPAGGIIADHVSNVGTMMSSGALQGLLVDIASVEQFGFTTLNELLDNPDAVAHFDSDGNGRADLNGCDDGWGLSKGHERHHCYERLG